MRDILVIQGGGRSNGDTSQLVQAFANGAMEKGHQVEIISLVKTEVKGCLGCNACRYGKPCFIKDGFNDIVPKIIAADLICFASPLFSGLFLQGLKPLLSGSIASQKKIMPQRWDAMKNTLYMIVRC